MPVEACFSLFVALLVVWFPRGAPANEWRFVEETVRVVVSDSVFQVEGEYLFESSPNAAEMVIRYPFPHGTAPGDPELLDAWTRRDTRWEPLTIWRGSDGWRWVMKAPRRGAVTVRVRYRQAMRSGRAEYVLRSTRAWSRPLRRATLEVRTPELRACRIRPRLEPARTAEGRSVYRMEFEDWMPEEDLVIDLAGRAAP